jgi:hypothetical protein
MPLVRAMGTVNDEMLIGDGTWVEFRFSVQPSHGLGWR